MTDLRYISNTRYAGETSRQLHYNDVIMGAMASQITSLAIVYSTVYSGANPRKQQSSASLAFVWGIHRWPMNSPHKWPVTRKVFPFDDVIMCLQLEMQRAIWHDFRRLRWPLYIMLCGQCLPQLSSFFRFTGHIIHVCRAWLKARECVRFLLCSNGCYNSKAA